jgi:hypothetical protein
MLPEAEDSHWAEWNHEQVFQGILSETCESGMLRGH